MTGREELHWRFFIDNEVIRYISQKFESNQSIQSMVNTASASIHRIEASILDYGRLAGLEEQRSLLEWFGYSIPPPSRSSSPSVKVN